MREDFSSGSLVGVWKITPGCEMTGGAMNLSVPKGDGDADRAVGMIYADTDGHLNFIHKPIQLEFTGLDIKGTAPAESSVFMALISDNRSVTQARNSFKLRIDRNGHLEITLSTSPSDGTPQTLRKLLTIDVTLPIKKLTLSLNDKKPELIIEDSGGPQTHTFDWAGSIDPALWEQPQYYLSLQAVTKADQGTTEVSLQKLEGISALPSLMEDTPAPDNPK